MILQVAYTFDAGPNAVMLAPNRKVGALLLQRLLFYFPPPSGTEPTRSVYFNVVFRTYKVCFCEICFSIAQICSMFIFSYILGDTSLLEEAGVQTVKDIEALPPPLESKDSISLQRYPGDVSYFICTKPGRGPMILPGDQSLLHPETGLPK